MSTPCSLADYEQMAGVGLPEAIAAYLFGASADEVTLKANRAAFDAQALLPRVLRRLNGGDTAISLFGRSLVAPVLVAPLAYQKLFHPAGEVATAQAAAAMGAGYVLSSLSSTSIEAVAAAGEGAQQWFQLYFQPARADTLALMRRAEAAGFHALVVTVDAPINGVRNREMRAGFALPPGIRAVNLDDLARPPSGMGETAGHPIFDGLMAQAPDWSDIDWLRRETQLPILIKGILHPDDAEMALQAGLDGIIVSNHGGRTLDTAIASFSALPGIAARVGGRLPVLLDGGVRRGTDILKALALGADAVLVGRPVASGLAVGGAQGAAHVLRILMDEFAVAMALCGFRLPSEINRACLAPS
jgi:4-hydroxymandelate oxidase